MTGYVITGMLFHRYQAKTPNTWRPAESWLHYSLSSAARIFACIAIGLLYGSGFVTMGKVIDEAGSAIALCAGELRRVLRPGA